MTIPNIEALDQLRRVVLAAPPERFRMEDFSQETKCGTAYCAIGWARLDQWHQKNTKINSSLDIDPDGSIYHTLLPADLELNLARIYGLSVRNAQILFGTSEFYSDLPNLQSQVVANIDRLKAGQDAVPYS